MWVHPVPQTGYTALHIAAQWNAEAVAQLLIDGKANVNARTKVRTGGGKNPTAAVPASGGPRPTIAHPARPQTNRTPLMLAAAKDAEDVARQLLEVKGCKLNLKGTDCGTALELAKKSGADRVAALLRERFDERAKKSEGRRGSVDDDPAKAAAAAAERARLEREASDAKEADLLRKMMRDGCAAAATRAEGVAASRGRGAAYEGRGRGLGTPQSLAQRAACAAPPLPPCPGRHRRVRSPIRSQATQCTEKIRRWAHQIGAEIGRRGRCGERGGRGCPGSGAEDSYDRCELSRAAQSRLRGVRRLGRSAILRFACAPRVARPLVLLVRPFAGQHTV